MSIREAYGCFFTIQKRDTLMYGYSLMYIYFVYVLYSYDNIFGDICIF